MRVAPIGLYMKNSELAGQFGAEASAITHGHPLGIIPAYVFATLIWYLSNTNLDIKDALDKSLKQYEEKFKVFDKENRNYFIDLVNKAIALSKENKSDIEAINELGEGWVAEETFAIAIYSCLKYSDNFKDAIVCSINHDGDSDSTGSVAGNIMGAYLGYEKIPFEYKNNIELKNEILELANDLASEIPVGEYNDNNDEYWLSKYAYCKRDLSLKEKQLHKNVEDYMNKIVDEYEPTPLTEEDKEFERCCKLYEERFGRKAYVAESNGTKEKTIEAIKTCLEKNEDLLDKILYLNFDEDMGNGTLY